MSRCAVCFKDIIFSKFKTIGEQIVCSLSCVGLLNANNRDICGYCKRPVWKDNYYKINNKYYCSEICKNEIINELKIPKNSKLIQFFQENIFNIDNNYYLKKSKQLREEVLRFYKDFHFDSISNNDEDDYSKKKTFTSYKKNKISEKDYFSDNNDENKNMRKKIFNKNSSKNSNLKIDINFEESYENSQIKNNMNKTISDLDTNKLKKKLTFSNIQNIGEKEKVNDRVKRIDKQKIVLRKFKGKNYAIDNKNKNEKDFSLSDNTLPNTLYNFNNLNQIINSKNNSFIYSGRNRDINTNVYINHNTVKSRNNESNIGNNYLTFSKNIKSPTKINSKSGYCMYCGNVLGNTTFLDRKGNHFCTDNCKEKYLKFGI